jgi:hypothetical protein
MLAVMQLQAHTERNAGLTGIAGAQHSVRAGSSPIGVQAKTSGQASTQADLLPAMAGQCLLNQQWRRLKAPVPCS